MIKIQGKVINFISKAVKLNSTSMQKVDRYHNNYLPYLSYYEFTGTKITKSQKEKRK